MHSDRNTAIVLREDSDKMDDEKSGKTSVHTLNTPNARSRDPKMSARLKQKETILSKPEESESEELLRIRNSRKFFTTNSRPVTREGTTFRDLIEGQNDNSLEKYAKTEGSMGLGLDRDRKYPKTFAHLGELTHKAADFELTHRPTMPVKEAPLRNLIVGMLAEECKEKEGSNPPRKGGKNIMQFSTRFEQTGEMDVPEEEALFVKKEVSVGQSPYFREPNQHLSFANDLNPYLKMDLPKSNFQEEAEDLLLKEKSPSRSSEGNMELEYPFQLVKSINEDFAADFPELNEVHSAIKVSPRVPPRQTVTSMDNSQRDNLDLDL